MLWILAYIPIYPHCVYEYLYTYGARLVCADACEVASGEHWLSRAYVRSDGTRSYFFEREELACLARDAGFSSAAHTAPLYVHSETENRKLGLRLQRSFIHAVFRK